MRLVLYNIRYGTGTGFHFHIPVPFSGYLRKTDKNLYRIIDFLKSVDPDVVGLIEVDLGSYRSKRESQAEIIADALGHYSIYGSKYSEDSILRKSPVIKKQGNAFLSREKILSNRKLYFSVGFKRLVIEIELKNVVLFLVHLSLRYRNRQHQLSELTEILSGFEKPVVVAGDLNTTWGEKELDDFLLTTKLVNVNIKCHPSYPSLSPRKQLDFILCSPQIHIEDFLIPDVTLSDHAPLLCDFQITD